MGVSGEFIYLGPYSFVPLCLAVKAITSPFLDLIGNIILSKNFSLKTPFFSTNSPVCRSVPLLYAPDFLTCSRSFGYLGEYPIAKFLIDSLFIPLFNTYSRAVLSLSNAL